MSIVSIPKTTLYSPKNIDGCQLWLDAADPAGTGTPPSNGVTVATWKDKSGKGRDSPANTTGATFNTNSQNGNGALSFTTGQYYTTPSFVATANNTPTVFLVCQQTSYSGSGNSEVIMATTGTPYGFYTLDLFALGGGKVIKLNIYSNVNPNGTISIASPTLVSVVGSGSPTYTATMWGNGTSNVSFTGSSTNPMSASSSYLIGAPSAFIGNIYEILFYDTPLSDSSRKQIEGYLAQKWGLTASLPTGHPGLTQTIYGSLVKSTVVVPIKLLPYNIYTNYNPLTATGSTCILWLDASDPTTLFSDAAGTTLASVNGTVGYWRDKSSSGFNCTQATLSYRPTYVAAAKNGRSILSFNGLSNFLNLPQFTAVPLTIFFVAQGTVFLTNTFFLSLGSSGNTIMMRMLAAQAVYGVDGTSLLIPTTNSDTNWHLWTLTISSSTVTFYFDGTLIGTSSWANGSGYTFATNTIASWNQQVGSKATTLNIPEILFYSAVLGTTQQQQVEAYLTEKWGLTSQANRTVASIRSIAKPVSVTVTGSFLFTTSPQYLSIPNNSAFVQNNTSFTYEFWFYPTSTNRGYLIAMLQHNWITVNWNATGSGSRVFGLDKSYVGNPGTYTPQNRVYPINNWYHVALSSDGTNGTLYINGVSECTFTGASPLGTVGDGNPLLIGYYQGQPFVSPNGYFANIRYVKGVAVYTGAFTPPTSPLTVTQSAGTNISAITAGQTQLLLLATNTAGLLTDSSTNNFTVTNTGSITWNSLTPFS